MSHYNTGIMHDFKSPGSDEWELSENNGLFDMFHGMLSGKISYAQDVANALWPRQKTQNPEVALEESIRNASTPIELHLSKITYERESSVPLEQNPRLHKLYDEKSSEIEGLQSSQ
jgi:hypothetical protein